MRVYLYMLMFATLYLSQPLQSSDEEKNITAEAKAPLFLVKLLPELLVDNYIYVKSITKKGNPVFFTISEPGDRSSAVKVVKRITGQENFEEKYYSCPRIQELLSGDATHIGKSTVSVQLKDEDSPFLVPGSISVSYCIISSKTPFPIWDALPLPENWESRRLTLSFLGDNPQSPQWLVFLNSAS